jgi:peptidyl-dipeptidase Dcp
MRSVIFAIFVFLSFIVSANPWLKSWNTPYGLPPFDELKASDYVDAVKLAVQEKRADIAKILENKEEPTFDNTIAPFVWAGAKLSCIDNVFRRLIAVERNEDFSKAAADVIGHKAALKMEIMTNPDLYARIKKVYDGNRSNLTPEEIAVLEFTHRSFCSNGVGLSEDNQKRINEISSKLSNLQLNVSKNILASNNAFKEKHNVNIAEFAQALRHTADRNKRKEIYRDFKARGYAIGSVDNRPLVKEILQLRNEMSGLLNYKTSAEFFIEPKMAKTPKKVYDFLIPILEVAKKAANKEIAELQKLMDEDVKKGLLPKGSRIEAWDVAYYLERLTKEKFAFENSSVKKYFKIDNVVQKGLFEMAEILYGLKFELIKDVPTYRPEASQTYKVTDADGSFVGLFIVDYHPRATKNSGAWMGLWRRQMHTPSGEDVRPIVHNCANIGTELEISNVITLFHEFGHALHGLLSRCKFPTLSCTGQYSDYSEIFSQFHENWAFMPRLLEKYAIDEKTGERIPDELIEKMKRLEKVGKGIYVTSMIATTLLDLKLHEVTEFDDFDVEKFESEIREWMGIPDSISLFHRPCHFTHLFSTSLYAAGYYNYVWANVMQHHLFSIFAAYENPWQKELAMKFRSTFLERGGADDPMKLFKQFSGADKPDMKPYLKYYGLID